MPSALPATINGSNNSTGTLHRNKRPSMLGRTQIRGEYLWREGSTIMAINQWLGGGWLARGGRGGSEPYHKYRLATLCSAA